MTTERLFSCWILNYELVTEQPNAYELPKKNNLHWKKKQQQQYRLSPE